MYLFKHLFFQQIYVQPSIVLSTGVTKLNMARSLLSKSLLDEQSMGGHGGDLANESTQEEHPR